MRNRPDHLFRRLVLALALGGICSPLDAVRAALLAERLHNDARRNPPNRSAEYRRRAEEARTKTEAMTNEKEPDPMLQVADTWERMAK